VVEVSFEELQTRLVSALREAEEDDVRKEIVGKYKEEYPKILIVTNMLLVGFDAPILQVQYLDKQLKGHRLLQAIARTNRPCKDIKEAGIILDYIGILKELKKAFEECGKKDISGVLSNLDDLRQEFTQRINETMQFFEGVPKEKYDRQQC